ncbi:DUF423 domain-containing protein [Lutibaculum baratangense]|uniref:Putative small membrane protein n=1 Tax=Lutibaculum baratangense AMV1 TaxID=631454 RepID=V4RA85_9HYPH|nr:DUF423 domain-containing protein [Lutibaculum baratangense]ESR23091.1 putative small membrane protein [Lutibaculum baratangense AMV1]
MPLLSRLLTFLAGIEGAAGVALAAIATHAAGGEVLALGAQFLILHAAGAVATLALAARGTGAARGLMTVAAAAMLLGAALFSGDLAMRALAGTKLLWGTAPYGGSTMIVGWLALGVGGLLGRRGRTGSD